MSLPVVDRPHSVLSTIERNRFAVGWGKSVGVVESCRRKRELRLLPFGRGSTGVAAGPDDEGCVSSHSFRLRSPP